MTGRNGTSTDALADEQPTPAASPESLAVLTSAAQQLRERVSPRSVEVADNVFAAAVRSLRRSHPVRAFPPHDFVFVGDRLVVDRLRSQIDDRSPSYAVGRIQLETTADHRLAQLVVELYVQYGVVILDAADEVRRVAAEVVAGLLGAPVEVEVLLTHVHVGDVTRGNPHLVDPADEDL